MKKLLASVVCAALVITMAPINLIAAGRVFQQNLGEIAGTAVVEGSPLNNVTVRLRNVDNGALVGDMRTNELGQFRFTGLPVGNYVVETVSPNGTLLGTSTRISLVAGALVATGVTVSTSAAAAAAAGVGGAAGAAGAAGGAGAAGAGAAGAAAAGGSFFATTAGILTVAAVGAGVATAAVVATNDASASR